MFMETTTRTRDISELVEITKSINCNESRRGYTALYEKHVGEITYFVRGFIHDENYVKDIVAETFEKAFLNISKFDRNKSNFTTWIYRIARNTAIDWIRMGRTSPDLFMDGTMRLTATLVDNFGTGKPNMIDVINFKQIESKIRESIEGIVNNKARKILCLYYDGYKYPEIVKETKCPLSTVKTEISRAKKHLQEKFAYLKSELQYC